MRIAKRISVTVLLVVALVSATACDKNQIREARKAAFRIQVVTDASIDTTATLYRDQVLSKEQTNKIARALLKINSANSILIAKAEAAKENTPGVRADLIAQVREVESAVRDLKNAGVLGIHSRDGSLAFDSALNAIDTALAVLEAALAGGGK